MMNCENCGNSIDTDWEEMNDEYCTECTCGVCYFDRDRTILLEDGMCPICDTKLGEKLYG